MPRRAYAVSGEEVLDLIRSTSRVVDAALEEVLRPLHLRLAGLVVLRVLARSEEVLTITRLAVEVGCSKQHASHLVARLVAAGLAEVRADGSPGKEVSLTEAGRNVVADVEAQFATCSTQVATVLTTREQRALARSLRKVRAFVHERGAQRADARILSGAGDTAPWLDGYVARKPAVKPKAVYYGVDENSVAHARFRHARSQLERYVACPTTYWKEKATG